MIERCTVKKSEKRKQWCSCSSREQHEKQSPEYNRLKWSVQAGNARIEFWQYRSGKGALQKSAPSIQTRSKMALSKPAENKYSDEAFLSVSWSRLSSKN